ncbi:uncharacterized protein LOC127010125 [Eriocheir sinensis]|uniref:uncharacterized protein LOC127010125 n=1 Tax=Eriocheir sinensis TaxID=95602 RepID=UPI0021C73027|nr:uncharacterized protein LOC127010125 [Eriocheir sinensis]XP_050740030.1 uncharacterized protein LOC127010125 [Eriocheir sinensis]
MTLRYWLALLCVTLSCGVLCDAYNNRLDGHSERAQAGGVWTQLGWPALPDFGRQVYTRPRYSHSRRLYAQRSFPTAGEASGHARWASARQASALSQPRVQHHALADRYHAASPWTGRLLKPHQPSHTVHRSHQSSQTEDRVVVSPAPATRREDARPAAQLLSSPRAGRRRPGHQWLVPRRYLTSPDSGRGQGAVESCRDGKVWQNGKCECPYLSNWNEATSMCDCVYGSYRHSSGNCYSY